MEYQKITNLLGSTRDEVPRFITEKWVEVHDHSGSTDDRYKPNEQIRFKTSLIRSDLCDFKDAYIVVKGEVTVTGVNNNSKKNGLNHLKTTHHLLFAFQKLIICLLIMQKI